MLARWTAVFVVSFAFVAPCLAQYAAEFKGHADKIHSVAISPDGKTLATASFDYTVKLWDLGSGKNTLTLGGPTGHTGPVYCVVFH
ncbi:MAG TPA: hypothetical protein VGZ47_16925, partial [Gemmataceae bacterium]|nr:hypothetical protein [Gemmataceae bacterium]